MTRQRVGSTLGFVAFILFLDMVGIGLIAPVMPKLLKQITGESIDRTAEIGGWLIFAYSVMQFLFAPLIGGLSDRFGRRPVLLATMVMLGVDYAIMATAPTLVWLFVARVISGIMGASWAAANSCIADVAPREERGRYFGIVGSAGASGFVIGPAVGGLLGEFDVRLPFMAASVLALTGATIGFFILRETLPSERRRAFIAGRANPFGTIIQMAKTPVVLGFLAVIFLMQLASQSQLAVWSYYNKLRFNWSELEIGLSITLFGFMLALMQGVFVGKVIARLGAKRTCQLGLFFGVPAYLLFAFAPGSWAMVVGVVIGSLSGISVPAMQQMMTARVAEDAQGELQGAMASMVSITSIFGPVLMTGVFGAYADETGLFLPGAPYLLATAIMICAIVLLNWNLRRVEESS